MLTILRRVGESVLIGEGPTRVRVLLLRTFPGGRAQLAIHAPSGMLVKRAEAVEPIYDGEVPAKPPTPET